MDSAKPSTEKFSEIKFVPPMARAMIDKDKVAVLLVNIKPGLANPARDFSPDDFRNNFLALAYAAKYFKLPTILTTDG